MIRTASIATGINGDAPLLYDQAANPDRHTRTTVLRCILGFFAYLIITYVTLSPVVRGEGLSVVPTIGVVTVFISKTQTWRTGAIELSFMMIGYFIGTLLPPIERPPALAIGLTIGNGLEAAIGAWGLRTTKANIITTGFNFTRRDLKLIWLYVGLLGPLASSTIVAVTFVMFGNPEQAVESHLETAFFWWPLRHMCSGPILVWTLSLLSCRVQFFSPRLVWPQNWGLEPLKLLEFLVCAGVLGAVTFFGAYFTLDFLYLLTVLMTCWLAYAFEQALNAVMQLCTFVWIIFTQYKYILAHTSGILENLELDVILLVTAVMSCYVSASQYEDESSHKHVRALLRETKARYVELQQSRDDLEAASKQSLLYAFMSHEFKTPLSIIIGFAAEIKSSPWGKETLVKEAIDHIATMAEDLLELTSEMLDMARIRAGKSVLNIISVDLHKTFNSATTKLAIYGKTQGVNVVASMSPDVPKFIMSDRMRLGEVIHNLGSNAVKFSGILAQEATSVKRIALDFHDVEAQTQESMTPKIPNCTIALEMMDTDMWGKLKANGTMVIPPASVAVPGATFLVLRITDQGKGIPKASHKAVFDVYERVGTSTEQISVPGTGLGLAIVKELVKKLGGGLHLCSEEGKGATFSVILQVTEPDEERAIILSSSTEPCSPNSVISTSDFTENISLHILVVEDMILNQKLISSILTRLGHTFELACNGRHGLQIILDNEKENKRRFDCYIADLFMPIMGGEEFIRESNKQLPPHLCETPVIIVSADIHADVRERLLQAERVIGSLEKPYRPAAIQNLLMEAVRKK